MFLCITYAGAQNLIPILRHINVMNLTTLTTMMSPVSIREVYNFCTLASSEFELSAQPTCNHAYMVDSEKDQAYVHRVRRNPKKDCYYLRFEPIRLLKKRSTRAQCVIGPKPFSRSYPAIRLKPIIQNRPGIVFGM